MTISASGKPSSSSGTEVSDQRTGVVNGAKTGMYVIVTPSSSVGSLIKANTAKKPIKMNMVTKIAYCCVSLIVLHVAPIAA
jgi:hypothetical protein